MRSTHVLSRALFFCVAFTICTAALAAKHGHDDKTVYGWVEKTRIEPWGAEVKAKLDTGALTSSLQATDIKEYKRDGHTWVRFKTRVEDLRDGDMASHEFKRPVFRRLKLTGAGGVDHRPVVLLKICMNDTIYEEQFSLRDRGDMIYPALLGRRTIKHLGLVDVGETFEHDPHCDEHSEVLTHADQTDDDDDDD